VQILWFTALFSAICLEGLGRRYLPQIPAVTFYFLKDVILVLGYLRFRPPPPVRRAARYMFRGFEIVTLVAFVWTVIEILNPEHESFALGLIGLRAYWLWWLAPFVIAGVLQNAERRKRAIYVLVAMSLGVAVLAAVQFASPANASVNLYSVTDGQEVYAADMATVASTGRARVSSTFTFLSGFVAFTLLVPTLLLSLGLEAEDRRLRRAALGATAITAMVVPMSGSRGSVLFGVAVLLLTVWTAGLFFTRIGRRVLIGGIVAAVVAVVVFPEAFRGVEDRFNASSEETTERLGTAGLMFPPIALTVLEYPPLGIGTGMQQNARGSFQVTSAWTQEAEVGRYLVELGVFGYLLVWTAKIGLMVALLRAYALLKRSGRRGSAAAALSYAALTLPGSLAFDHNWQALYFTGLGFILAEVVRVQRAQQSRSVPVPAAGPAGGIARLPAAVKAAS
jgi:hypothetical protein